MLNVLFHVPNISSPSLYKTPSLSLSLSPEEVCYETVPAILGLARAMKGTAECRAKAFREICGLEGEPEGGGGGEISFTFDTGDIIKLKNMVSTRELYSKETCK